MNATSDWPRVPLPEAFWFQEGPGVRNWQFTKSGIKLLNVANIEKTGHLNLSVTDRYLDESEVSKKYSHFLVDAGDLVIASSGISFDGDGLLRTRGAFIEPKHLPLCLNTSTVRFKPIEGVSDLRFLRFWLNGYEFRSQITRTVTGTAQQNFGPSHLKALRITLPPLAEQRRIADALDRAEALQVKRRSALAQLDTLAQSIFLDLFGDPVANPRGWPRLSFGHLLTNIDSGWSPICLDRPVMGDEWGILKLGAVTWCEYDSAENKALPPEIAPDPRLEVKAGDLLFTRKNTYDLVAACALVRSTPPKLLMSDLIFRFRLRPDAEMDERFLHQLLIYPTKRKEMQKLAGGSASSMPNISKERLQSAPIEKPPLALQRDFAHRLEQVEKLKATHRAALAELNSLFLTLQHRAFLGELWK